MPGLSRLLAGLLLFVAAAASARGEVLAEARAAVAAGEATRAVKILRAELAAGAEDARAARLRVGLAEALLAAGRAPLACNELARAERIDAPVFASEGGAALRERACGTLREAASVAREATSARDREDAAQVFVVPRLLAGSRQLWRPLAEAGAELVFVRAFHRKGDRYHEELSTTKVEGVYFANEHAPVIEDRLALDCAALRAQGLRCHAWMTTRATPLPKLGRPSFRDVEWNFRTGEFETVDRLDPFDPRVERVLKDLWRSLARAGVDGVLLQDDLMMRQLEGFSEDARRAWRRRTGRELVPEELVTVVGKGDSRRVRYEKPFWEFAELKRDRLLDLAESLQAAAREVNPRFETSLNLYYETAINPPMGLAWMSQELDAAAQRDFRRLAVMAYHRQIEHELSVLEREELWRGLEMMAERLAEVPDAERRVLVKLQGIDWRTREPIPPGELARAAEPFRRFSLCLAPSDDPELSPAQLRAVRGSGP